MMETEEYSKLVYEYIDRFGGIPLFLMRGVPREVIVEKIRKAFETGEPMTVDSYRDDVDY